MGLGDLRGKDRLGRLARLGCGGWAWGVGVGIGTCGSANEGGCSEEKMYEGPCNISNNGGTLRQIGRWGYYVCSTALANHGVQVKCLGIVDCCCGNRNESPEILYMDEVYQPA